MFKVYKIKNENWENIIQFGYLSLMEFTSLTSILHSVSPITFEVITTEYVKIIICLIFLNSCEIYDIQVFR